MHPALRDFAHQAFRDIANHSSPPASRFAVSVEATPSITETYCSCCLYCPPASPSADRSSEIGQFLDCARGTKLYMLGTSPRCRPSSSIFGSRYFPRDSSNLSWKIIQDVLKRRRGSPDPFLRLRDVLLNSIPREAFSDPHSLVVKIPSKNARHILFGQSPAGTIGTEPFVDPLPNISHPQNAEYICRHWRDKIVTLKQN